MSNIEVTAVLATSRPLIAYGGIQIDEVTLEAMATDLRDHRVPMLWQHDIRRPATSQILDAGIRDTSDGFVELCIRFEVDEIEWANYEQHLRDVGAPGGFSFYMAEPLAMVYGLHRDNPLEMSLAADAHHWTDTEILTAANSLRQIGNVAANRRYEFAIDPGAVAVLTLAWQEVLLPVIDGVISAAIYDGLTRFLKPNERKTTFHVTVDRPDGRLQAHIETNDRKMLKFAIEGLNQIVGEVGVAEWNGDDGDWRWPARNPHEDRE